MRYGKIIVLVLIVALGITGYFLWEQSRVGRYKVWVAAQEIMPGTQIVDGMIRLISVDQPIVGLNKEAILGKTATVRIPKDSVVSTGVDTLKTYTGSLVNIPVNIEITGLVGPGDMVELVGVSAGHITIGQKLTALGKAQVAAVIDKKGQIHRYGPVLDLPAVLVVEVKEDQVGQILEFIANGKVYPVLGGVKIDVAPDIGQ